MVMELGAPVETVCLGSSARYFRLTAVKESFYARQLTGMRMATRMVCHDVSFAAHMPKSSSVPQFVPVSAGDDTKWFSP